MRQGRGSLNAEGQVTSWPKLPNSLAGCVASCDVFRKVVGTMTSQNSCWDRPLPLSSLPLSKVGPWGFHFSTLSSHNPQPVQVHHFLLASQGCMESGLP